MIKKILLACVLLIFLHVAMVHAAQEKQTPADRFPGLKIGMKAPDFELVDLTGKKVKLSNYKGKKVMVNFWATWCPPCKAEMPDMQKFHQEMGEEIVILAVNIDPQYDVKTFTTDLNITFPVLLDEKDKVNSAYQILTIPTTYFIDEEGFIKQKYLSVMTIEKMKELAKTL